MKAHTTVLVTSHEHPIPTYFDAASVVYLKEDPIEELNIISSPR